MRLLILFWGIVLASCTPSARKTGGPCTYQTSERRLAIDSAKAYENGGLLYAQTELLWWEGERRVVEIRCDSAQWMAWQRAPQDSAWVRLREMTEGTCTPFSLTLID